MITADELYFTAGYTLLTGAVSFFYYIKGKASGIVEVLTALKEEEPELSQLFIKRIEERVQRFNDAE